jgi:hypothetical protein
MGAGGVGVTAATVAIGGDGGVGTGDVGAGLGGGVGADGGLSGEGGGGLGGGVLFGQLGVADPVASCDKKVLVSWKGKSFLKG